MIRQERFWKKVKVAGRNDCWEWSAYKCPQGYGRFKLNGSMLMSHRISFEWATGIKPNSLDVLHTCDNPSCVNPKHLFLGTDKDNASDRKNKNRNGNLKGEQNGRVKITESQVLEIRQLYSTGTITQKELAKKFNLCNASISLIVNKKNWKHI